MKSFTYNTFTVVLGLILGLGSSHVAADELPDWLDNKPSQQPLAAARSQRWFVEAGIYRLSHDAQPTRELRSNVGLDVYSLQSFGTGWGAQLSGRIDLDNASGQGLDHHNRSISLRELYASGPIGELNLDIGRISIRDGVSPNFNPSDVFRVGALTTRHTENPARLRESRLGVVGLRAQTAFLGGSVSAMLVPHLASPQTPHWYDPQWGVVNEGRTQAYLMYAFPSWQGVYANVLAHQQQGGNRTFGSNLSMSLGQSWVASLEVASTERSRLAALAQDASAPGERYAQAAMAISYTTPVRATLTLEYDYNGGGLTRNEWSGSWQGAAIGAIGRAIGEAGRRQEPLNAHALMSMLQWDRFLVRDSQLDLLFQYNAVDHSRLIWSEWRYLLPKAELALNVTRMNGTPRSQYGISGTPWTLGWRARFYF